MSQYSKRDDDFEEESVEERNYQLMTAAKEEKLFALPEPRVSVGHAPAPSNWFALPQMDEGDIQKPEPIVFGDRPQASAEKPN